MPRAPKRCGAPHCEQRVIGRTYCDKHQAEHDRRANTTARGYGWTHQQARRHALATLTDQHCTICGQPLQPTDLVDLDHTPDRTGYRGLAHRRCNARDGQRRRLVIRHKGG